MPPERRRLFVAFIAVNLAFTGVCVWAFATGRPAIGIGLLVAVYVLPNLILIPFRIRDSNRRAREARARREASTPRPPPA
jgi:hypothetical protein